MELALTVLIWVVAIVIILITLSYAVSAFIGLLFYKKIKSHMKNDLKPINFNMFNKDK